MFNVKDLYGPCTLDPPRTRTAGEVITLKPEQENKMDDLIRRDKARSVCCVDVMCMCWTARKLQRNGMTRGIHIYLSTWNMTWRKLMEVEGDETYKSIIYIKMRANTPTSKAILRQKKKLICVTWYKQPPQHPTPPTAVSKSNGRTEFLFTSPKSTCTFTKVHAHWDFFN